MTPFELFRYDSPMPGRGRRPAQGPRALRPRLHRQEVPIIRTSRERSPTPFSNSERHLTPDTWFGHLFFRLRARPRGFLLASAVVLTLLTLRSGLFPALAPTAVLLAAPAGQEISDPEFSSADTLAPGEAEPLEAEAAPQSGGEEDLPAAEPEADLSISRATGSSRGGARPADAVTLPAPAPEPSAGDRIAALSQQYLGYRYSWGGASPSTGFDCSGFSWYVYREAAVYLPGRDLGAQLRAGPRITRDHLLPGDLVFFENTYEYGLSHSGIYLGGGNFIHAETYGSGVRISSLNDRNWASHFVSGSRPW